jgi:hypothetical protein
MAWKPDGLASNCAAATPPSSPRASKIVRLLCDRPLKIVVSIIFSFLLVLIFAAAKNHSARSRNATPDPDFL